MACNDCVKLSPLNEPTAACKKSGVKVEEVRLACGDELVVSIAPTASGNCDVGYIDDVVSVDPVGNPTPLYNAVINNKEDFEESDGFTFDRTTSLGEQTHNIVINVRVYDDEQQCTFDSLKGQDVVVFYKLVGRSGDFQWRRFAGKVTTVAGGLVQGYEITIDTFNPAEEDKPLFVNIGGAGGAATEAALDALTVF